MAIHQCPKCELKFAFKTELDDHCWHDHPTFHHEYPASPPPPPPVEEHAPPARVSMKRRVGASLIGWLNPKHSPEPHHMVPPSP